MCCIRQIMIHTRETLSQEVMYFQGSQVVLGKEKLLDHNLSYSKTLVSPALANKGLTHSSRELELIPTWIRLILSQNRILVKAPRFKILKQLSGKWPLTSKTHISQESIASRQLEISFIRLQIKVLRFGILKQ